MLPNRMRVALSRRLLLALTLCLALLSPPLPGRAQIGPVADGLLAYYPFNGSPGDESGRGHHPVLFTGALGQDRFGRESRALHLRDSKGLIAPDLPMLRGANPRTLAAWIKADPENRPTCAAIFLGGTSTTTTRSAFGIIAHTIGSWGFWGHFDEFYPVGLDNQWHHHVITYTGSLVTYYLDGLEVGRHSTQLATIDGTLTIGIQSKFTGSEGAFAGSVDDVRLYDRALSSNQVRDIFDWEFVRRDAEPRPATALGQVVNGFLVGVKILDPGFGYIAAPKVSVTGGGGTGAQLQAAVSNGVLASITVLQPGSGYTNPPLISIAPPPMPPARATAVAQVVNGFVVALQVISQGNGYASPPLIRLVGGSGSGAQAVAELSDGRVTTIVVTNPGAGYSSAPTVLIASPPFVPSLAVETSRVRVRLHLVLGRRYLVESSTNLQDWVATGDIFTAEDEEMAREFDVEATGRYFRVLEVL